MKAVKDVCMKCINKDADESCFDPHAINHHCHWEEDGRFYADEENWRAGVVYCPHGNTEVINDLSNGCLYFLEHLVCGDIDEAQQGRVLEVY